MPVEGSDFRTPGEKKANYTGGRPKDESKLSTEAQQVRIRLRRAAKRKNPDGRLKRDAEVLYGKALYEWDVEELARGRPRDKNGGFSGRAPKWITPLVVAEAKRRLLTESFAKMASHTDLAIKTLVRILKDDERDEKGRPITDSRTKLAAAQFIIEHVIGKPKAVIEIGAEDFTKQAIAAAIVLDDGEDQSHLILEGEVVEDEEDDDDEPGE